MIFVFSEDSETAFEILAKARELAGKSEVAAISIGDGHNDYIAAGADRVYSVDMEPNESNVVECICALIAEHEPEILLIGGTKPGKEVAPRIAQRSGAGCVTDCIELSDEGGLVAKRLVLGGRFIAAQRFLSKLKIATLPPRRFEKKLDKSRKGEIIKIPFKPPEPQVQVIEIKKKAPQVLRIEEADVIVSAGRGIRKKEDLSLVKSLAEVLGAALGCSRSVAVDLKWLPEEHWIGLSGHKVKPRLYIAVGISGQVQHIAGIRDAKTIVAINKDPNAPIFKACDYGIVGDLYDVVPRLTEMLRDKLM